jgi:hypothetical protein
MNEAILAKKQTLAREEWIEQYSGAKGPGEDHSGDG